MNSPYGIRYVKFDTHLMTPLSPAAMILVGGMTLRLRDPESPVKNLPQSPRRLDTPQSPRDIFHQSYRDTHLLSHGGGISAPPTVHPKHCT